MLRESKIYTFSHFRQQREDTILQLIIIIFALDFTKREER